MNRRQKGNRLELEFKKILEDRGYAVEKTKWSRFGSKDFFNLFDLFCLREDGGLLVQVKSNQTRGAIKQLSMFKKHPKNIKKIVAVKYDRGEWREIEVE